MMRSFTTALSVCLLAFSTFAQHAQKGHLRLPMELGAQRSAGSFTYMFENTSSAYADLTNPVSINNGEVWDDPAYVVSLPFTLVVNGSDVNSLTFGGFGAALISENSPGIYEALFPFEADLIDRGTLTGISVSPISYQVEGAPGSQIFKIEWKNAGSYEEAEGLGTTDMFINLQLWVYEGTNAIEFRFGPSMINDTDLFYAGETGAIAGLTTFDEDSFMFWNDHFLSGLATDPELVLLGDPENPPFLDGTPADGTVYRFYLEASNDIEILMLVSDGICGEPNGTATADVSGGEAPYTFDWSTGDTTQMITDLAGGSYFVTVTDNTGATATAAAQVFVAEPLTPVAGSTDETSSGANDGTAWSNPEGGVWPYTFEWSNGATEAMIFGLAPGAYTVTVTDDDGCTASETVIVNAFDCPEVTIEVGLSNLSCFGACDVSIVILDVSGGVEPYSYLWSTGSTEDLINDLCAGVYTLTLTDADGCIYIESYAIFEPEQILVNAGSTDETAEDANDGTAWAAPSGGIEPFTYVWSTGATDAMISDLAPGIYGVTVSDANGCTAAQSVVVNAFGCALDVEATFTATCNDACSGSIVLTVLSGSAPFDYLWSDGSTGEALLGLCEGIYAVTVTDADGCIFVSTYFLFDLAPVVATTGVTHETGAGLNDGTAWVVPGGGLSPYSYEWSNGSLDSLITDLEPGTYFVTVSDVNGCSTVSEAIVLPFGCVGFLVSTVSEVSCHGGCDGALSISAIGGVGPFTYLWSTGDTTQLIEGICADTYTVLVTDLGQGCNAQTTFELTQPDFIDGTVDEVVHITDSTEASISITVFGGTPPYTFDWHSYNGSFSSTDEDISGMPADYYFVLIRDANDCEFDLDSIQILDLTVGTKDLPTLDVKVYPNPATTMINMDIPVTGTFTGSLITNEGRVLLIWTNDRTLDIRNIASGVYTIQIVSGSGNYTGRLAIIR